MRATESSLNRVSARPGELEVVGDVAAGLLAGHGGHGVAQGDALLQGGQDGEFHGAAQGGLADEQAGEGRVGVEVVVGEHPYGLELLVAQQVGLVDDQDGGFAALVAFGGQDGGGLGGEPGAGAVGLAAEGGDDHLVQAADADHGVGQVDDGVPGGVQAGQDGADRGGLAGPDFACDDADRAFADAPGDAGDGLVVGGVAVQHARGQVAAERHPGEPVVGLELVDHVWSLRGRGRPLMRASCCWAASRSPARAAAERRASPRKITAPSTARAGSSPRSWPSFPAARAWSR